MNTPNILTALWSHFRSSNVWSIDLELRSHSIYSSERLTWLEYTEARLWGQMNFRNLHRVSTTQFLNTKLHIHI